MTDNKFQNGKIYKIVCNTTGLVYYGSSSSDKLRKRLASHKCDYKRYLDGKRNYVSSFEILKNNNFEIILIENYPCNSRNELHTRERYYIENNECVNQCIPLRTPQEYREDNKEKIIEKHKNYYENNKEKIKEYYENNIDKINERKKSYNEQNKDKIRETQKIYNEQNKDKIKEIHKLWVDKNKDKIKQQRKESYEQNKKEIIKKRKEYAEQNREKIREYQRKYREAKKQKKTNDNIIERNVYSSKSSSTNEENPV